MRSKVTDFSIDREYLQLSVNLNTVPRSKRQKMIVIFTPAGNEAATEVSREAGDCCSIPESNEPADEEGTDLRLKHIFTSAKWHQTI